MTSETLPSKLGKTKQPLKELFKRERERERERKNNNIGTVSKAALWKPRDGAERIKTFPSA